MVTVAGRPGLAPLGEFATDTEVDAALAAYGAIDVSNATGVDPTGTTECSAALTAALTAAASEGRRAYASGTFKVASTVTLNANADLGDATLNYTAGSGTAVLVGTTTSGANVSRVDVVLPAVIATLNAAGEGWSDTAAAIGVDIVNVQASRITVPHVAGFGTGLRVRGVGAGAAHNQITVGHLNSNKVNLSLTADSTGWSNENLYLGGRLSHESAEGSAVSGARQIKMAVCTNPVNNNVFLQPSLEGDVPEYHAEIAGAYNRIIQGRWEATTPSVLWQSDADSNVIDGGYDSGRITATITSGAVKNDVWGTTRHYHTRTGGTSGVTVLENTSSSAYPSDAVMAAGAQAAGADPATAYAVHRGANYTRMKRNSDTYDRIILDHQNGRVYLGDASAAPVSYISGLGAVLIITGGLRFSPTATYDIGSASLMPKDLYLSGMAQVGGALNHDGTTVGFYGTTPVTKQTGVAVTAEGIHAALVALGLFAA